MVNGGDSKHGLHIMHPAATFAAVLGSQKWTAVVVEEREHITVHQHSKDNLVGDKAAAREVMRLELEAWLEARRRLTDQRTSNGGKQITLCAGRRSQRSTLPWLLRGVKREELASQEKWAAAISTTVIDEEALVAALQPATRTSWSVQGKLTVSSKKRWGSRPKIAELKKDDSAD
ncbi:hypothetical protein LR48_Vigan475s000200 [Vigna angularis]|uniref:Uncharacterized protein n=1 Tax=Phaseolus angularis TaxID=3914 RepID=A0A0L9TBJ3_PHAAN|nr:hypothetical protein LR48_Vigan475s000200 [Vigna angularis]